LLNSLEVCTSLIRVRGYTTICRAAAVGDIIGHVHDVYVRQFAA
jgi:hypothetical protein